MDTPRSAAYPCGSSRQRPFGACSSTAPVGRTKEHRTDDETERITMTSETTDNHACRKCGQLSASCSVMEDGGGPDWHLVYRHSCGCSAEVWTSPRNFDEGVFVCPLCGRDYRLRFLGGHPKPEREVFENLSL